MYLRFPPDASQCDTETYPAETGGMCRQPESAEREAEGCGEDRGMKLKELIGALPDLIRAAEKQKIWRGSPRCRI